MKIVNTVWKSKNFLQLRIYMGSICVDKRNQNLSIWQFQRLWILILAMLQKFIDIFRKSQWILLPMSCKLFPQYFPRFDKVSLVELMLVNLGPVQVGFQFKPINSKGS